MLILTWKYGDIKVLSTKTSMPYKQKPNILTHIIPISYQDLWRWQNI